MADISKIRLENQDYNIKDAYSREILPTKIFGFDTISAMTNSTELTNGNYCRTYGKTSLNDGYSALYKIRNYQENEETDGENIVAIGSITPPTLVAEKIFENANDENYLIMGDSYGAGYTPDGNVTGWCTLLKNYLGLDDNHCYIIAKSGAGFVDPDTFLSLLQSNINSIKNKKKIKKIVVCAGYNDRNYTSTQIQTAIEQFSIYCAEQFPNAKIYIGQIGWNTDFNNANARSALFQNVLNAYSTYTLNTKNCHYLNGVEFALINTDYMSSDHYHPNQTGQQALVRAIAQSLKTGNVTYSLQQNKITVTPTNHVPNEDIPQFLVEYRNNNMTSVYTGLLTLNYDTTQNYDGANYIVLGNYNSKFIQPLAGAFVSIPVMCYIIDGDNNYHVGNGQFVFREDGELRLYTMFGDNNGWSATTFKRITTYNNSQNWVSNII